MEPRAVPMPTAPGWRDVEAPALCRLDDYSTMDRTLRRSLRLSIERGGYGYCHKIEQVRESGGFQCSSLGQLAP